LIECIAFNARMEQAKNKKYRLKDEESKTWVFKYVDEKVKGIKRL
jgi:hypothetical protein